VLPSRVADGFSLDGLNIESGPQDLQACAAV
jgi:hypothetical protein